MTDSANRALLPAGLRDILPLDAEHEAQVVGRVMGFFAARGYERVKPPLIEFEDTLLDGAGAATASQCFRVMDPMSQRMMGVRADMTPQVARIAVTRLAGAPRPLRLCYAGQVLRVKGSQLRPERQFGQAGIELFGSDSAAADAEVAVLAAEALRALGVPGVSIDLSLPTLVPALLAGLDLDAGEALRGGLDHKDAAAVAASGGTAAPLLSALLASVGPAERALGILAGLDLPAAAAAERDRLAEVVALIQAAAPEVTLTIDPVENRGFEYHAGIGFTLFARNLSGELGRGGRYLAGGAEAATGATLFLDSVLAAAPLPEMPRRLFLPSGTPEGTARAVRADGWITVPGLEAAADPAAEAKRLNCRHYWAESGVKSVE
ncbi:ATP phosphoribosyltransferase regulatory subunit [Magnetospirillum sp. UT-4]|uniref:ATP phosphoribosyltransferase regulatory subunit n=1 Tax=Magnetospirillum sp. UT-4 TaxID=2681467 RepID=UPI00137DA90D|nr:ATP phosphoribosyltransferase regulatory subunit [Magnetospirillum sp. UT-4]CAA7625699.1 ATP phosphoribosyltransferase regulatory subunit [Magnetospirillum sp. UT-4]